LDLSPFLVLDYGCGKLRYSVHLAKNANRLTLVDSEVQLARTQVVCDETCTIREYVEKHWRQARVINHLDFRDDNARYDFVLCANVLSAIPYSRTRMSIVKLVADRLTARGQCLFICQYTNSYFCTQMADPKITKYADGFIKGNCDNASFYGLIKPPALRQLVLDNGLEIRETWIHDQSGYVIAQRPH